VSRESTLSRLAAHAGAFTAFGLGALYLIGAFLKTTELRGAGLRVQDLLPLIPIEQLLARGIATTMTSAGLTATVVLALVVIDTYSRPTHDPLIRGAALAAPLVYLAGLLIGTILAERYDLMSAAIAAVVVTTVGRRLHWTDARTLVASLSAAILALGVYAWYFPKHLPLVVVYTVDGKRELGSLVAVSDRTWYLNKGQGYVTALPAEQIVNADFSTKARLKIKGTIPHTKVVTTTTVVTTTVPTGGR